MGHLNPEKLHVRMSFGTDQITLMEPRRYTLTHSDLTGDLFLTIGPHYDRKAISGFYTRLMRDEVLAEWIVDKDGSALHVYCHVSGGLVFGFPGWRYNIFRYHLPQVLEAFRYGDKVLFESLPELDRAAVIIHFQASQPRYCRVENWGKIGEYRLQDSV